MSAPGTPVSPPASAGMRCGLQALESVLLLPCAGEQLLALLHAPAAPRDTAVVVIVGGPQYRAGSHRQFTLLARRLAADGWPVLRFDQRGMGDSSGAQRSFEHIDDDIVAAIDGCLGQWPAVRRVVLWGLCDGASAALLYVGARRDLRVAGLCLLNPWVRSEVSLAQTHVRHYYLRRLKEASFWRKLLRGQVAVVAGRELLRNLRHALGGRPIAGAPVAADFRTRMADAWRTFPGAIWLGLSGNDYTAKEFSTVASTSAPWTGLLAARAVQQAVFPDADHTFSVAGARLQMEAAVLQWLQAQFGAAAAQGAPREQAAA